MNANYQDNKMRLGFFLRRQHSNMIHLLFPKKNCVLRFHISNFCKVFLVEFEMLFRMRPLRNKLIPLTEKISC